MMASVTYGNSYYGKRNYGKFNYDKCIYGKSIMANVIEPNVFLMINFNRQMLSGKCSLFINKFCACIFQKNTRFPVFIFHTFREFDKNPNLVIISIFCNIFQEKRKMCKFP